MSPLIYVSCAALLICHALAKPGHTLIQPGDDTKNAVDDASAAKINALKTSWRAKVPEKFRHAKVSDVKRMVSFFLILIFLVEVIRANQVNYMHITAGFLHPS